MIKKGAVLFDRDGVLNQDQGYIYRPQDFVWIEGAQEAIRLINELGWYAFVVSNQSGVARGYYAEQNVEQLHRWMQVQLHTWGAHIDAFRFCPHHPDALLPAYRKHCSCRKPQPGMIRDLLQTWNVIPEQCFLVGDRTTDLEAAKLAGVKGYLFERGNLRQMVEHIFLQQLTAQP